MDSEIKEALKNYDSWKGKLVRFIYDDDFGIILKDPVLDRDNFKNSFLCGIPYVKILWIKACDGFDREQLLDGKTSNIKKRNLMLLSENENDL